MVQKLKFKFEDFLTEDIPNLMINIWCYSDDHGVVCTMCTTYKKMCIDALKKKNGRKITKTLILLYKNLKKETFHGLIYRKYQVQTDIFYFI